LVVLGHKILGPSQCHEMCLLLERTAVDPGCMVQVKGIMLLCNLQGIGSVAKDPDGAGARNEAFLLLAKTNRDEGTRTTTANSYILL